MLLVSRYASAGLVPASDALENEARPCLLAFSCAKTQNEGEIRSKHPKKEMRSRVPSYTAPEKVGGNIRTIVDDSVKKCEKTKLIPENEPISPLHSAPRLKNSTIQNQNLPTEESVQIYDGTESDG